MLWTKTMIVIGCSIAALTGANASADPFLYQGQLKDDGQPANGMYDLSFQLMDSLAGGSVVGSVWVANDVEVLDGLFEVEVDFLTDHQGGDRWIEVQVRDGDSEGPYSTLSPRQPLLATPEAQHAKTADTVLNPTWYETNGYLNHGEGTGRVFINRTDPITSAEYFGVHAEVSGFVGMYVSGLEGSSPFYGYSTGGSINAYTYYDSPNDSWKLWSNGGVRLTIDSSGDVVVQNDVVAETFVYESPKTFYTSVSGNVFTCGTGEYSVALGTGGFYMLEPGLHVATAPVDLPHGAVIQSMRVYFDDIAAGSMVVNLGFQLHASSAFGAISSVDTAGFNGTYLDDYGVMSGNPTYPVVDHQNRHYHIEAYSLNWSGNTTIKIRSVVIEYTMNEVN